jgi:NAD(P)-dependent dehydrogenase (short-subunit alcohol dehydrogenase family)
MTAIPADSLDGARVVVIGGSSGIGRGVAEQALARGADVVIAGRDEAKLARIGKLIGSASTAVLDAHDDGEIERFFARLGSVDHVVSLVGDSMVGGFLRTSPATMRHVLDSKFWANWMIGRGAASVLRPGGSAVFTAGTGGRADEISASYVANLAITALVQGLAVELAPDVRVNAVAPTFMGRATAFWREVPAEELAQQQAGFSESVPLGRTGTVSEVASAYLYLMGNSFVTGQVLAVDGGVMLTK